MNKGFITSLSLLYLIVFFNFYIDNQYSHLKVWKNSKLLGEIKQLIW